MVVVILRFIVRVPFTMNRTARSISDVMPMGIDFRTPSRLGRHGAMLMQPAVRIRIRRQPIEGGKKHQLHHRQAAMTPFGMLCANPPHATMNQGLPDDLKQVNANSLQILETTPACLWRTCQYRGASP
jgi:hypothetical protein